MSTFNRVQWVAGLVILVTAAAACGRPDRDRDPGTPPEPQLPVPQGAPSGPSSSNPAPSSPCTISLDVSNNGVSSAVVLLNGAELVAQSAFPDERAFSVPATAVPGINVLEAKVNGKPGDVLHLIVSGEGMTYLDVTLTRSTGKPVWVSGQFEVPDCLGNERPPMADPQR